MGTSAVISIGVSSWSVFFTLLISLDVPYGFLLRTSYCVSYFKTFSPKYLTRCPTISQTQGNIFKFFLTILSYHKPQTMTSVFTVCFNTFRLKIIYNLFQIFSHFFFNTWSYNELIFLQKISSFLLGTLTSYKPRSLENIRIFFTQKSLL